MGKLQEIFGKESGIRPSDIERLVEAALEESVTVEYKTHGRIGSQGPHTTAEALVLKPVISFLNRAQHQSSLLVIGVVAVNGTPSEVVPVPATVITLEKINSHLRDNVGSAPAVKTSPSYRVVEVKCGSRGNVYLVEVNNREPAAYYSRLTERGYIRKGDSSSELSMAEFLDLVARSRSSAAALGVSNVEVRTSADSPGVTYSFRATCGNYGTRPASFVSGFLEFVVKKEQGVTISPSPGFSDVSNINPGRHLYEFTVDLSGGRPVYPGGQIVMGELKIQFTTETTFEVRTHTNDADGSTEWRFRVTAKGRLRNLSYLRTPWG